MPSTKFRVHSLSGLMLCSITSSEGQDIHFSLAMRWGRRAELHCSRENKQCVNACVSSNSRWPGLEQASKGAWVMRCHARALRAAQTRMRQTRAISVASSTAPAAAAPAGTPLCEGDASVAAAQVAVAGAVAGTAAASAWHQLLLALEGSRAAELRLRAVPAADRQQQQGERGTSSQAQSCCLPQWRCSGRSAVRLSAWPGADNEGRESQTLAHLRWHSRLRPQAWAGSW